MIMPVKASKFYHLTSHLEQQIVECPSDVTMSDQKVRIRCRCGTVVDVGARSLARRWANESEYRCKSCDVKTYVTAETARRLCSGNLDERKEQSRKATEKLWHSPECESARQSISRSVSEYDRQHPKNLDRARIALRKKYSARELSLIGRLSQKHRRSVPELVIESILKDFGVKFTPQKRLGYYAYDFLVEPVGQKPFIIEVQGEFWHRDSVAQDSAKATYVYSLGYDVKHVWEHEFNELGKVKFIVAQWLGLIQDTQVDFDFEDVVVRQIDCKSARVFLGKYHYLPAISKFGFSIGAFIGDELIAVAIFSLPVRLESTARLELAHGELYELSRFCIHPSRHKKNFATWFMRRAIGLFRKPFPRVKAIISFADETAGHVGTIYRASNWVQDGMTKPDYHYVSPEGYIVHKKTVWDRAKKMGRSENDYAAEHGYAKIMGKEKARFIFRLKVS
jgi:very-short-patch-repair endonuclease